MEQLAGRADLRGVFGALERRRWLIVSTVSLTAAIGLLFVLISEPVYEARAEVLIEPDVPATDPQFVGRVAFHDQELSTQQRLVTSDLVLRQATESLGLPRASANGVRAVLQPDTRILDVTARSPDPQRARDLAQAVAETYLTLRREQATALLTATRDEIARQVAAAEANVARLDELLADPTNFRTGLDGERYTAVQVLNDVSARLAELDAGLEAQSGGGQIIEPAAVPSRPVEPAPLRTLLVAVVLGLGVGVVLAMARDALDEAVRSDEDVTLASGRPIIGRVPRHSEVSTGGVALLTAPESPEGEAYRDLRTNLRFAAADVRTVAITSSIEAEGKSTVAANLAVAASLAGFDVVLIDADLRRPSLHTAFGVPKGVGLSDVLAGEHELFEVPVAFEDPPIQLITAGRLPPNPSEMLGSQRLSDVLSDLEAKHDLVIIDTPPTLAASDAQEVASLVDAVLVVVEHERAGRRAVRETVDRLERAGGRVVGVVSNRVDPHDLQYGYYRQH